MSTSKRHAATAAQLTRNVRHHAGRLWSYTQRVTLRAARPGFQAASRALHSPTQAGGGAAGCADAQPRCTHQMNVPPPEVPRCAPRPAQAPCAAVTRSLGLADAHACCTLHAPRCISRSGWQVPRSMPHGVRCIRHIYGVRCIRHICGVRCIRHIYGARCGQPTCSTPSRES
jgi:hypothetical protein